MKKIKIIWKSLLPVCALVSLMAACTQYDTPLFVEENEMKDNINGGGGAEGDTIPPIARYILWINIEGAGGGDLVRNALPDDGTIKGRMLPHSKYMWSGLEAEHVEMTAMPANENYVACASLLTGALPARHRIKNDSYISEQQYDPTFDESLKNYPSVFHYIYEHDESVRTLAITPWATQNEVLFSNASRVVTTSTDEETMDEALKSLKEEKNRITYVSLRGVLDEARNGGWTSSNTKYMEAIRQADANVGRLLNQLESRRFYYYEDWLVIVTSNHGGKTDGTFGGNSREERQMFGFFYFPHFSQSEDLTLDEEPMEIIKFDKDYQGFVSDTLALSEQMQTPGDTLPNGKRIRSGIFNLDSLGGALTVEVIMSARPAKSGSFSPVLGGGYYKMFDGKDWFIWIDRAFSSVWTGHWGKEVKYYGDGNFTNQYLHTYSTTIAMEDMEGYVLTDTVKPKEDSYGNWTDTTYTRKYQRKGNIAIWGFYDGIPHATETVTAIDKNSSSFSGKDLNDLLFTGRFQWEHRYVAEIRIWNKKLDEATIRAQANKLNINPESDGLISYWQFYKGEQYSDGDSIVYNQVKRKVRKRIGEGRYMNVTPKDMVLRKKNANTISTDPNQYKFQEPVTDLEYGLISNTLRDKLDGRKRLMESTMVLPVIFNWFGITSYPTDVNSEARFSKLDAPIYERDLLIDKFVWRDGNILGDYTRDMEWRDWESK